MFYAAFPITVALLRGTTADTDGNVTMEREALTLEALSIAQARKNSGGVAIVQVERATAQRTLPPRDVRIPGILVDAVVVARPQNHMQTFAEQYNPAYTGETWLPHATLQPLPLDERKIVARRAIMLLKINSVSRSRKVKYVRTPDIVAPGAGPPVCALSARSTRRPSRMRRP